MAVKKNKSAADDKALSDKQKKFDRLNQKLSEKKDFLKQWQNVLVQYQQYIEQSEIITETNACKIELLNLLDRFYSHKACKRSSREKISYLITTISKELIENHHLDDLVVLYNKYSKKPFSNRAINIENSETATQAITAAVKSSKPAQKIYRKILASLYAHSVIEDTEFKHQTDLLQHATGAYHNANFLELLAFDLKVKQIEAKNLTYLSGRDLKYTNKIIEEQLAEINYEVKQIKAQFAKQLKTHFFCHLPPEKLIERFDSDIEQILKFQLAELQNRIHFFNDQDNLKNWLKKYKVSPMGFTAFNPSCES